MSDRPSPDMSVIIATPDYYETIRKTIKHLRAQTVRGQLEIVIVVPSADTLSLDESELKDFHQFRVVEVGAITSIAWANAAGVRQATAPVVVLAEDHAFPAPGWAEALIAAHRQPWAAVGPAVRNANPKSLVSWADLLIAYVPWLVPAEAGVIDHLPGHNSSYKRAILLDYGPDLEAMMQAESVLHWDLRAKGYLLYLEPAATIAHMNLERLSSWIPAQLYSGRVFAAARARHWSLLQRFLYAGSAPLIPVVRFLRIWGQLHRSSQQRSLPLGVLPILLLGLIVSAAGEMMGYAFGAGDAKQKLSKFEFHRVNHLAKRHRQAKAG
jgi:GT2 family glycosyltransferase